MFREIYVNSHRDKCLDRQHPVGFLFGNQQRFLEYKYRPLFLGASHSTFVLHTAQQCAAANSKTEPLQLLQISI